MSPQRGRGDVLLVLVFVPIIAMLLGTIIVTLTVNNPYAQSSAPSPTPTLKPVPKSKVDSKKLSKKERSFIVAVEAATQKNLPVDHERNVLTMGHTYCAAVGAGYSKDDIIRLYGKRRDLPEAKGVNLLDLSQKTLCPRK